MIYKLKKSIHRLKEASCQWHYQFYQVSISFHFEMNMINDCIYHKFSKSKNIFWVSCVNDILFANNNTCLLHETKRLLQKKFEIKDFGDASFVFAIQIHQNCFRGILRLL